MKDCVLISAAGTASGYHLVRTLKDIGANTVSVSACDTNPPHLVACSGLCDSFFQVPPICDEAFSTSVVSILDSIGGTLYVPLIDQDMDLFPADASTLANIGCRSTAPPNELTTKVTDKVKCAEWLRSKGIPMPKAYSFDQLEAQVQYFVKPRTGFGSRGTRLLRGIEIESHVSDESVIQEKCFAPEITIEIYHDGQITDTLCRERLETKVGVCTKARVFRDHELHRLVQEVVNGEPWPVASCVQVMKNRCGDWVVTDVNLRIGAGSAMCSAVGWDLARAAVANWLRLDPTPRRFLNFSGQEQFVVRTYSEIVTGTPSH